MTEFSPTDSTEQFEGTPASGELPAHEITMPARIDRYRVSDLLGKGGFGAVFRALDESLGRDVAIKVPRRRRTGVADYERWKSEARMIAMMDHPNIVPVFDVGSTEEFPFYVVSKFIEGEDLRTYLNQHKPSVACSISWVELMAEALQHAHANGLIHRDVKPSNILIDKNGQPWLTDFGLALREEEIGRDTGQKKLIGTVAYMSPEQARGEGHLVDGRADIFALGIIMYELLSGSRPFKGGSSEQLLRNIVRAEPRPLRQWDPRLPVELERICMKALAQRRVDRYDSAFDMAEDLRRYVAKKAAGERSSDSLSLDSSATIIPKGLRSFDEHDRDFFLRLVPGPRDRDRVPEVLRGLKLRIEAHSPKDTFRAGLLYGSSGSGKSSLVRAGLIPLLNESVQVAYVECNAKHTETRLRQALAPFVEDMEPTTNPVTAIAAIRQGALGGGQKVLIVLDQFEQWLHAHREMKGESLVNAIRQCDGTRVQCLALIRDDFWMAATRFFHELEIRLVQDINSTAVDRFDLRHARYVLSEFGRAYGCLPEDPSQITTEQVQFLEGIIDSVQEDGKVISVHVVVLAQMLKSREWNLDTLAEFQDSASVGINFLDATFSASTASPHHRSLQAPARAVLGQLLPEVGTNIKGQMRSVDHLCAVSGLGERDFEQLVEVLDGELRLITPAVTTDDEESAQERSYQLTHDFLVPSLREWLTRNERQSVRGRAKLRLRELSQYWKAKNEKRFLPNILEYLRIVTLTNAKSRTADETRLVAAATAHHGVRWSIAAVLAILVGAGASSINQRLQIRAKEKEADLVVKQLMAADTANIPEAMSALKPLSEYANPVLQSIADDASRSELEKLPARLVLVKHEPEHILPLVQSITTADVSQIQLICRCLESHSEAAKQGLWSIVESEGVDETHWMRAALALGQFDASNDKWKNYSDRLTTAIVNQTTARVMEMADGFSKLARYLIGPTRNVFLDRTLPEDVQLHAAIMLSKCLSADDPGFADLLVSATPSQFDVLFPVAAAEPETIAPSLKNELDSKPVIAWPATDRFADLDATARNQLEQSEGYVTDTFAVCQKLLLSEFKPLAELLRDAGYRPNSVRPYRADRQNYVAVVWHRDGKKWELTQHMGPEGARELGQPMRERKLYPKDVAVVPPDSSSQLEVEYVVLWTEIEEPLIDVEMYIGVRESDHQNHWDPLFQRGYKPRVNLKLRHPDGGDRYASIRVRSMLDPPFDDCWNDFQDGYDSRMLEGWYQADIRLNEAYGIENEVTFSAVWYNGGPIESKTLYQKPAESHLDLGKELADSSYRPVCLSVIDDENGPLAASVWHRPAVVGAEKDRRASRRANALIALLRMGQIDSLWSYLEFQPDPRLRSFLIDRFSSFGIDPNLLVQRLSSASSVGERMAILAALVSYRPEQLTGEANLQLRDTILELGTTHRSAALHSSCDLLTRRWNWHELSQAINSAERASETPKAEPTWFTVGQGHTMVAIKRPGEFQSGSPGTETYRSHQWEVTKRVNIPRAFAISDAEVTVAQYLEFEKSLKYAREYTPSKQCPVNTVSYYDAMRYCRWLSEKEKIPKDQMCYPELHLIGAGCTLPENFLERTGYRLPTESEWEYACRAETITSRFYGDSAKLLPQYAWTESADGLYMLPVKQLLPNQFGLFDTLGNVMEWCQDRRPTHDATKRVYDDSWTDDESSMNETRRLMRGSSVWYIPSSVRCAYRETLSATSSTPYSGFRIARTLLETSTEDETPE